MPPETSSDANCGKTRGGGGKDGEARGPPGRARSGGGHGAWDQGEPRRGDERRGSWGSVGGNAGIDRIDPYRRPGQGEDRRTSRRDPLVRQPRRGRHPGRGRGGGGDAQRKYHGTDHDGGGGGGP